MEKEEDYSWTENLRDYIEEGYLPTNSEEIFEAGIGFLTSEDYRRRINGNFEEARGWASDIPDEDWEWAYGLAGILMERGYSERNFRIMVQQCIGGVFETGFVIGQILSENGIENQWSDNQAAWDRVLQGILELSEEK